MQVHPQSLEPGNLGESTGFPLICFGFVNPVCRIEVSPSWLLRFTSPMKMNSVRLRQRREVAVQNCDRVQNIPANPPVAERPQGAKKGTESGQTIFGICVSMVGPEGFEPPTKRL